MTAATSTTWLFVPGDRPDRFAKAAATGADAIILDLEDAVDVESKAPARAHVSSWLHSGGTGWVRINAAPTSWHADDLAAIADAPGLLGVMLAKAEDPLDVDATAFALPDTAEVVLLVETAVGVHRVAELAAARAATRLAFGSLDFALDLGADPDCEAALLLARSALVIASRVAGLPAPLDGVTSSVDDSDRVEREARGAKQLGFGGKLLIHPAQVDPAARAFLPSPKEMEWAHGVLAAAAGAEGAMRGADGLMVDRPVLERARGILAMLGERG
jgi:citrate lyase subunit beta / citryl-CoA lyase